METDRRAESVALCCDYRDHSPGPCACPDHRWSVLHPFGNDWLDPAHSDGSGSGDDA